jgi:hypothetical protein
MNKKETAQNEDSKPKLTNTKRKVIKLGLVLQTDNMTALADPTGGEMQ